MNRLPKLLTWFSFALVAAVCVAAFQQRLIPIVSASAARAQAAPPAGAPDQGQDPAAVNLAPAGLRTQPRRRLPSSRRAHGCSR